jgi:hypothetical protein
MPVFNLILFRRECNVLVEGRGNRDLWNAEDLGLKLRIETAKTFSLEFNILHIGSSLICLSRDAKNIEVCTLKKMKEIISNDYCPTDKLPSAFLPCVSFSACKGHSLLSESCYTVSCSWCQSVTLSKTSFVSTECLALRYGEEHWRLILQSSPPQAFS